MSLEHFRNPKDENLSPKMENQGIEELDFDAVVQLHTSPLI